MPSLCVNGTVTFFRVWVGEDHPHFAAASSEASAASVGVTACGDFTAWSKSTMPTACVERGGPVQVEVQDSESDEFWAVFDEGAL